jgi:CRP/FNR family transcriptional regulator, cyclic AMP receptor protein
LLANSLPGRRLTEILGNHPDRVSKLGGTCPVHGPLPEGENSRHASFAPPVFPTNMVLRTRRRLKLLRRMRSKRGTSQKAGSTMAIEKCINEFDVDEVIFEEGSTGRELFVVLEGKVDIAKVNGASKTVIVTLGKGEFFGEMAVIDGSSRSASAISAAPNTRVMRINHARFVYLVSQQPAFALMIMDALSKRLRASNAVTFRAAKP